MKTPNMSLQEDAAKRRAPEGGRSPEIQMITIGAIFYLACLIGCAIAPLVWRPCIWNYLIIALMVFVGAGIVMAENIPDLLVALAGKSSDDALDAKTIGTLLQHADSATGPYIAWNYILVGMMGLCGTIGIGVRQGKRTR